jgi:hypothetical protein
MLILACIVRLLPPAFPSGLILAKSRLTPAQWHLLYWLAIAYLSCRQPILRPLTAR